MYVDDILLTGNDYDEIQKLKSHLDQAFTIKDLGQLHYFLGIEVSYTNKGIVLTQHKYTKDLLAASGIQNLKKTVTPLPLNLKLRADEGTLVSDPSTYRTLIGKLNFLSNTRPDLAYTIQHLSQYMQQPQSTHWDALVHTLHYVNSTCGQGIVLQGNNKLTLQAFSDSDWGACCDSRRSVSGFVLLLGNSPIRWKSKKQPTIARSSSEAEYRAIANAASEVTWVVRLLQEFGLSDLKPVTLHCDNISAIHIAKNPVFHERTKHIDLDCHFTREKILEGLLQLTYLPTKNQLVVVLTKILPFVHFKHLLSKLEVCEPHP